MIILDSSFISRLEIWINPLFICDAEANSWCDPLSGGGGGDAAEEEEKATFMFRGKREREEEKQEEVAPLCCHAQTAATCHKEQE